MAAVIHRLACVPLLTTDRGTHRGFDPNDDAYCRDYARYLVDLIGQQGWRLSRKDAEPTGFIETVDDG